MLWSNNIVGSSAEDDGNVGDLTNLWLLSQGLLPIDSFLTSNIRRGSFEYRQSSLPPFNNHCNDFYNKLMFENVRDSSDEEYVDIDNDNWPQQQFVHSLNDANRILAEEQQISQKQSVNQTKSDNNLNTDSNMFSLRNYVHHKGPAPSPPPTTSTTSQKDEDSKLLIKKECDEKAAGTTSKRETII